MLSTILTQVFTITELLPIQRKCYAKYGLNIVNTSGIEPGFLARVPSYLNFPIFQDDFPIFQDDFQIFQDSRSIFAQTLLFCPLNWLTYLLENCTTPYLTKNQVSVLRTYHILHNWHQGNWDLWLLEKLENGLKVWDI